MDFSKYYLKISRNSLENYINKFILVSDVKLNVNYNSKARN